MLIDGVSWAKRVFHLIENYQVTAMDISPSALLVLHKLAGKKLAELVIRFHFRAIFHIFSKGNIIAMRHFNSL